MTRDERVHARCLPVSVPAGTGDRRRHGTAIRRGTRLADAEPHRRPRPERAGHRSRARTRRSPRSATTSPATWRSLLARSPRIWRTGCAHGSSSLGGAGWPSTVTYLSSRRQTSLRLVEVDGETAEMFGRVVADRVCPAAGDCPRVCPCARGRLGLLARDGGRRAGCGGRRLRRRGCRLPRLRRDAARASGQGGAERTPVRPHPARAERGSETVLTETGELRDGLPGNSYRNIRRAGFAEIAVTANWLRPARMGAVPLAATQSGSESRLCKPGDEPSAEHEPSAADGASFTRPIPSSGGRRARRTTAQRLDHDLVEVDVERPGESEHHAVGHLVGRDRRHALVDGVGLLLSP